MSSEEDAQLKKLLQSTDRRVWQRARIIQLSREGVPASDLPPRVGLCYRQVLRWLRRFNSEGPGGLQTKARSGRPPRINPTQRVAIARLAERPPTERGLGFARWSCARLALAASQLGIVERISAEEVRRTLRGLGYRPAKGGCWSGPVLAEAA